MSTKADDGQCQMKGAQGAHDKHKCHVRCGSALKCQHIHIISTHPPPSFYAVVLCHVTYEKKKKTTYCLS